MKYIKLGVEHKELDKKYIRIWKIIIGFLVSAVIYSYYRFIWIDLCFDNYLLTFS